MTTIPLPTTEAPQNEATPGPEATPAPEATQRGGTSRSGETPDYAQICAWIYTEARYQDEHHYDDWEGLWTDDALYWVPANGNDTDPQTQISIIYDNRARIGTRIRQLKSGSRFAQTPRSTLRRIVGNIEVETRADGEIDVAANFQLSEWRVGETRVWAGRTYYRLRLVDGALRMSRKTVQLINLADEVPTMAFLI